MSSGADSTANISPSVLFRSDMFKSLYELLQLIPGGPGFLTSSIRVRLVLDANVVQGELRWRLKRKKPAARSDLQEAIDSGIITAVAPTFLESEIEEHLPRIAAATKKSVLEAKAEWLDFRARIQLYAPKSSGDAADHAVDPDDVLYKVTCEELGADAIFTNDRDLKAMNVPVIGGRPERALRDAARSNSVVLGITVGTGLVVTVSYGFLRSVYWMLDATLQGFRSLPGWVKLLIIGVGLSSRDSGEDRRSMVAPHAVLPIDGTGSPRNDLPDRD